MRYLSLAAAARKLMVVMVTAGVCVTAGAMVPTAAFADPGWISPAANLSASPAGALPTPMVASNARGDTVVVWGAAFGGPGPISESERPAGGSFTTATQPVLMSGGADQNQNSAQLGSVGIDDAGTIHVFFMSGNTNSTWQVLEAVKPIGGPTWTVNVIRPKGIVSGTSPNPPVYGAVAPNGAAVAIWLDDNNFTFTSSKFAAATRAAGSSTWSAGGDIPGTTGGGEYVRAAIDPNGDAAGLFGFSLGGQLRGATMTAGGAWTTANQITTSAGGSSSALNGSVAISSAGEATATWDMTNSSGNLPVVQFATKPLAAATWPQAPAPGGANDLSTGSAGVPTLAIAPDGTTTVAYTLGATVVADTRPAGGSFASTTLPNTLTSPANAEVVAGGDNSTTVLWSGVGTGNVPIVTAAYRAPGGSSFAPTPNAPGSSNANVVAAADGVGDVAAVWQAQTPSASFEFHASGLVTAGPTITNVVFPTTAKVGTAFPYSATVTPDQWTTTAPTASWNFGDGTTGALTGSKTYAKPGTFNALLTATGQVGNASTAPVSITVTTPSGGGGGTPHLPGIPKLHSSINRKKHTAKFSFSASRATSFRCALVKRTRAHKSQPKPHYSRCSSPKTYKKLHTGSYQFLVRAQNKAGLERTPATKSFKI